MLKRCFQWFYVLLALAFITWGRWGSMIYPLPLNPDEVQTAANALRIMAYGISWDVVDGNTVGPLNSLILCWPYLFGGDVTISTIRLTATVLIGFIFLQTYLSLKTVSGIPFAILFSLPLAVFYSLTGTPDFLHYSSELLSLSLLLFALYETLKITTEKKTRDLPRSWIILLGMAIGAVPFAKLQAAPIAFLIGIYALCLLWFSSGKNRIISTLTLLTGAVLPAFALLVPLIVSGTIHHFYYSYIAWSFEYIKDPLPFSALRSMIVNDPMLNSLIVFSLIMYIAYLVTLGLFLRKERPSLIFAAYAALLTGAAAYAIVRPGNAFPHYLMLLPPFALLLVGALGNTAGFGRLHREINGFIGVIFLYSFMAPSFISGIQDEHFHFYAYQTSEKSAFRWRHPNLFVWLSPMSENRLLVWGRMPQYYIWTGLPPATRESVTYNQMVNSRLSTYFRSRLINDFNSSPPDFIIDSNTGKTFNADNIETHGIFTFPELAAMVEKDYVRLGLQERHNSSCPTLFAQKNIAARLKHQLVGFRSITASSEKSSLYSASRVDDWSVAEDACIDYWLLPNGKLGSIRIEFHAEERIRKLLILNTKEGSRFYRGTDRIQYTLLNKGNSVLSRERILKRHPEWTIEVFDSPITADSLVIEILSFEDNGGGLNEIKVIRDSP